MAKILHMADMHLDAPFTSRLGIDKSKLRRSEQRLVFSKIIDYAKNNAEIVLISGDLFDSSQITDETINLIKRKFDEVSPLPIFISPGNHDPFTSDSTYAKIDFGDNVYVFRNEYSYIDLDELKLRVSGIGFSNESGSNITKITNAKKHPEYTNILTVHGNVVSGALAGDYNPISKLDIEESGFDYIALGHVHSFSGINKTKNTLWAYPGIPEPRGFDELCESGIIIGEVSKLETKLDLKIISERRYHIHDLNISDIMDNEQIIEAFSNIIQCRSEKDIYQFILKGIINPDFYLDKELILARINDSCFFAEIIDETKPQYDLNVDLGDNSVRAEFIRTMQVKIKQSKLEHEKEVLEKALYIGLDSLNGKLL